MMELRMYILGRSVISEKAVVNLQEFLDEMYTDRYHLEIIDVLENPHAAERDNILVTPTVIKYHPNPVKRVIGNLCDRENVEQAIELLS